MLRIIGDVCFADGYFDRGHGVGTSIRNGLNPFSFFNRKEEDFWIGNFECVCGNKDVPFVVAPDVLSKINHLNLYGVANNHIMQIGEEGFQSTLNFIESVGSAYVGTREKRSTVFMHQGKTVGIIAFSQRPDNFVSTPLYWHLPEFDEIRTEIEKLNDCDYRIAYIHWGFEFINYPNISQRQMAHWLIDNGIDLVVGMHPHVSQGMELYSGKPIYYSIGNAVFNMAWSPTHYGVILTVDLSKDFPEVSTEYLAIGDDFIPRIVSDVPSLFQLENLNRHVTHWQEDEKYFEVARVCYKHYAHANRLRIARTFWHMSFKEQKRMIQDFIRRKIKKQ